MNVKLLALSFFISVYGIVSVAQTDKKFIRNDHGEIILFGAFFANGLNPQTNKKDHPDACTYYHAGNIPTLRQLASEAQTLGAKGILEVSQVDPSHIPSGYSKFSVTNADGLKDEFYYSAKGYQGHDGNFGTFGSWSSSMNFPYGDRVYGIRDDSGDIFTGTANSQVASVRCPLNAIAPTSRVSAAGIVFTHDSTNPNLPNSYRDPHGLIWSDAGFDFNRVMFTSHHYASAYCRDHQARLASRAELIQLGKDLGGSTFTEDGFTRVLPGLKDDFYFWGAVDPDSPLYAFVATPGQYFEVNTKSRIEGTMGTVICVAGKLGPSEPDVHISNMQVIYSHDQSHPSLGNAWKGPHGLIWGEPAKNSSGLIKLSFEDAKNYCASMGNRLPTNEEYTQFGEDLGGIGHFSTYENRAIDPDQKSEMIADLRDDIFTWSSAQYVSDGCGPTPGQPWIKNYVRCVHSGSK